MCIAYAQTSFGYNFALLSLGQMISRLLVFALIVHLTQTLPVNQFGIITFATNVLLYANLIVDCGFDILGPLEVARRTEPLPLLVSTVVSFRLLLVVPAFIALALFTWLAPIPLFTKHTVLLYGLSLLGQTARLHVGIPGGRTDAACRVR